MKAPAVASETKPDEIEVTPAMRAAGRREMIKFNLDYEDHEDAAVRVFLAMQRSRVHDADEVVE